MSSLTDRPVGVGRGGSSAAALRVRRKTRAWHATLAALTVAAATAVGWGALPGAALATATHGSSGSSGASGTLEWAGSATQDWDPVTAGPAIDFRQRSLVYASLTTLNAKGQPVPDLAKSWSYNKSGTQLTFTLRSGLKFSDGTPVNAQAVKAYLERGITSPESAIATYLEPIQSITVLNSLQVRLNLHYADYQLPLTLAERVGGITSEKAGEDPSKLENWPVGAGPFIPTKIVPGQYADFKKNPNYWDASAIHIAKVQIVTAPASANLVSAVKDGTYDLVGFGAEANEVLAQAKSAGVKVLQIPGYFTEALLLNVNKAPFNNPDVYKAISYAINRKALFSALSFGYGQVTNQLFPPGTAAYDKSAANYLAYDPSKAKAELKAAGYGSKQLEFTVYTDTTGGANSGSASLGELLQQQLAAVGIKLNLDALPVATFYGDVYGHTVNAALAGASELDSPTDLLLWHYGNNGEIDLSDPLETAKFTAAIKKVEGTPLSSPSYDANLQAAAVAGLESDDQIFLFTEPEAFLVSNRLTGYTQIPGYFNWDGVRLK